MYCANCGKEMDENAKFCPSCGTNVNPGMQSSEPLNRQYDTGAGVYAEEKPKGAMAALVCGIIGVVMSFIIPLVGLILSIVAISQGSRANKISKTGIATIGYILGIAGIIISIIVWIASAVLLASLVF